MQVTPPLDRSAVPFAPSLFDRIGIAAAAVRDWLDARGRPAWIASMILGFVLAWPVGLGLLFYMIATRRFGQGCGRNSASRMMTMRHHTRHGTGNSAFDAYRDETLRRLEDEHAEFLAFLARLREAKDKSEFDAFMNGRGGSDAVKPEQQAA